MAKNPIEFGKLNQKMGRKKPPRYPDDPAPRPQPKIPNRMAPSKKPNGGRSEFTLERRYPKPPKGEGIRKPAIRPTLPKRPPSKDAKPAPRQYLKDNSGGTAKPRPRKVGPRKKSNGDTPQSENPKRLSRPVPMPRRPRKPINGKMPAFAYPERYTGDGRGRQPKPAKPPKRGDGRAYPKAKVPKMQILPAYPKDKKPKITTLPYKPKPRKKTLY